MKETIEIEIRRRRLSVEIEGITQVEVATIARAIEERMGMLEDKYGIADSSKLAIMTAFDLAVDLHRLRESAELGRDAAEQKLEQLSIKLKAALTSTAG